MPRFAYVLSTIIIAVAVLTFAQESTPTLGEANRLFEEKSWKLALNKYDALLKATPPEPARREAAYRAAVCQMRLDEWGNAKERLNGVIKENADDVWAGRAHWQLEFSLANHERFSDGETSPLVHLRKAEEILIREKASDLVEFYQDIVKSLGRYHHDSKTDREWLFSTFDKVIPLLKEPEEIAEALLRKAQLAGYTSREPAWEARIAGARQVVSEYPETRVARSAQVYVAGLFSQRGKLVEALKEYRTAAERWPGSAEGDRATTAIRDITRTEVRFMLTNSFTSDEPIKFDLWARNTANVTITAEAINLEDVVRSQRRESLRLDLLSGRVAHSQNAEPPKRDDYHATSIPVELQFHEPGAYVLRAQSGEAKAHGLLIISDIDMVANSSGGGLELWVVDAKTGRPRSGAEVMIASDMQTVKGLMDRLAGRNRGEQLFTRFEQFVADADGFVIPPTTNERYTPYVAVARHGQHVALLDHSYHNTRREQPEPRNYMYTDRPVYRPEQQVYWKAIMRDRREGEYRPSDARQFRVEICDPRGNVVHTVESMKATTFGTISGELKLAPRCPLGVYSIAVMEPGSRRGLVQGDFRVEEYKKPEFEVSVTTSDKLCRTNSTVRAEISAKYYFGAPVTDAEVQYTVRRRPKYFWPFRGGFGDDDLGWFDKPEPDMQPRHNTGGDIVASGNGSITSDGKFQFEFKTTVPPPEPRPSRPYYRWWWPPQDPTFEFQIEATVTDKSRRNIDGSASIVVGDKALKLTAQAQQHLYSPGDLVKAKLGAHNLSEEPVATKGTLFVEKVEYLGKDVDEKITTLSQQTVDVPASGSLNTTWRIPTDQFGQFRFFFLADDPFGGKVSTYGTFTVVGPDTPELPFRYEGLQIIADKEIYRVGDTARVLILSEFPDAIAWYWIDSGTGNLDRKLMPLPQRSNLVEVPIRDTFVPNTALNILVVKNKQVIHDQVDIVVPPMRSVMNVVLRPNRENYKPGQEGTVDILATDHMGKPISSEFSLAMFDRSLLYIAPETREDIRRFFYGQRRDLGANLQNTLSRPSNYNMQNPPFSFAFMGIEGQERYRWDADHSVSYDLFDGRLAGSARLARGQMVAALPDIAIGDAEGVVASKAMPAAPMVARPCVALEATAGSYEMKGEAELVQPELRTDFRDAMFWSPSVVTDSDGKATAKVKFPDSLTTWRINAVGVTADTIVGQASTESLVKKNLLLRLEAPRFFRERDSVTLSGIVHNYLETAKKVQVRLKAEGIESAAADSKEITVAPEGEARVDWVVDAKKWGSATIRMEALTDEESDAVEMKFPVLAHGIDKFVAWNGSSDDKPGTGTQIAREGDRLMITREIDIPRERIHASTKLTLVVNPSLASALRDALPYLVDYPYGCVEQTMSRFMPAVVVGSTFDKLNVPRDEFLAHKLQDVTKQGLERILSFQHSDGGWGWWRDDQTDPYISAYVMYGLTLAKDAGADFDQNAFQRGIAYLRASVQEIVKGDAERSEYWRHSSLHSLVYQCFVLALNGQADRPAIQMAWNRRDELSPHGLAMLARVLWRAGRQDDARVVLRNMFNHAVITPENDTARWGRIKDAWYWWHDAVESTAHGLMAYLEIDPQNEMVQRSMKWLVLNREGNRWKSTKDSAHAILALTAYMKDRKETATSMHVEVAVGELPAKAYDITPQNFWDFDGRIVLEGDAVPDGKFPVRITTSGGGTLFYSVFAEYFTLEEGINKAGNEIYVERTYEKLVRDKVDSTTGVAAVDRYVPVSDGDTLQSGDELRVTLRIKSLNDYEYLVFEDAKPAGMEPVDVQSGGAGGGSLWANMELRDELVAFFITHLPQGEHRLTYNCRAEIPGTFHTMPTRGYAMYYPPLRANSDELVVKVVDKPAPAR